MLLRNALSLGVALCGLAAPLSADEGRAALERWATEAGQAEPRIRIGMAHQHAVIVSASGAFRLIDIDRGTPLWKERFEGNLRVVADGGPTEGVPSVYRVQVGAFADESGARAELARLSKLTGTDGVVHFDPDRAQWRVRLGSARERLELGPLMDSLRAEGLQGLWIAEEPTQDAGGVQLRLVDDSYESFATQLSRIALVPLGGSRLSVEGKHYRGIVELRVSPFGTVRPINWVELEQYLLGVVPAELGPAVWPELEALKAQAVAARTYAVRNLRQFADEGFDLCDTPRCQVYAGADAEHPLSDRAVRATAGEVMVHDGEPIVALYTSTCGGHTEDGFEIFPEHRQPYLKGVPCRAEGEAAAEQSGLVHGAEPQVVVDESGRDVTSDWNLLRVAGVLGTSPPAPEAEVTAEGLRQMSRELARLAGLPPPARALEAVGTLTRAVTLLVEDLGWGERARVLVADEDIRGLLRGEETRGLDLEARRVIAYLAWSEALAPFADGRFHLDRPPTYARLVPLLAQIGESYLAFELKEGVVADISGGNLRLVRGKAAVSYPLAPSVRLFGLSAGKAVAVAQLELWPGDRIHYRTAAGKIDYLALRAPVRGTSDDRASSVYSWEVRRTRRELEQTINSRVSVGMLQDLQVVRRGRSGRIVELKVVGSRDSQIVRGFDVRRLLDLRESLIVMEPQRDAAGRIEAVVFAGKGWGHGVGLCQVGAYGMALRGSDYVEILTHYYSGAKLRRGGASAR